MDSYNYEADTTARRPYCQTLARNESTLPVGPVFIGVASNEIVVVRPGNLKNHDSYLLTTSNTGISHDFVLIRF